MLMNAMGSARVKAYHLHIFITLCRSCSLGVLPPRIYLVLHSQHSKQDLVMEKQYFMLDTVSLLQNVGGCTLFNDLLKLDLTACVYLYQWRPQIRGQGGI